MGGNSQCLSFDTTKSVSEQILRREFDTGKTPTRKKSLLSSLKPFAYVFSETAYVWLMGSALASGGSVVEPSAIGCVQHMVVPALFTQMSLLWSPNS